jgi:hypothetical protein
MIFITSEHISPSDCIEKMLIILIDASIDLISLPLDLFLLSFFKGNYPNDRGPATGARPCRTSRTWRLTNQKKNITAALNRLVESGAGRSQGRLDSHKAQGTFDPVRRREGDWQGEL